MALVKIRNRAENFKFNFSAETFTTHSKILNAKCLNLPDCANFRAGTGRYELAALFSFELICNPIVDSCGKLCE